MAILVLSLLTISAGCSASNPEPLDAQHRYGPVTPKAYIDDNSAEPAARRTGEAYYGGYYEKRGLGVQFDASGWTADELKAASFIHASNIYFHFDSAALTSDAKTVLGQKASRLKAFPQLCILIGGHSDERGSEDYNQRLGERRAKAAYDYLVSLGVSARQLNTKSFGKKYPFAIGNDESSWSQNRRDEFLVSKP